MVALGGLVAIPAAPAPLVAVPALAEVVLVVLVLDDEVVASASFGAEVGTVKAGAPAVSVVPEPPLPQPARQMIVVRVAPKTAMARRLRKHDRSLSVLPLNSIWPSSGALRRRAAPCACRNAGSR